MLAGGKVPNISNTELDATTTALIYWPHAMGDYDPIKKASLYGLCRSLPDITNAVFGNSLVWHKGKVWCISKQAPMQFDFGSNAWSTPADNDSYLLKRTYTAVVSYGDFIYMFGGTKTDTTNSYFTDLNEGVIAWNPETHQIKKIANLPPYLGKSHISAVALGSHIYLFGGKTNSSSSVGSPTISDSIYRFTP